MPVAIAGARPGAAGSKHLLRAALGERLPEVVRRRDDKTGWGPYLAHLLRGPAGEAASALLRGGRLAERGWVDEVVLVGELERFRAGVGVGGGGGRYGHGLAFLPPLLLELWLRTGDETGGCAPGAEPAAGGAPSLPIRHASPSASGLRRVG